MKCVGENPDTHLVEVVELPDHRWYIGTQYHPEYSSTVLSPNPLAESGSYDHSVKTAKLHVGILFSELFGMYIAQIELAVVVGMAYGSERVSERHRHRFEFNNSYRQAFENAGMKCVVVFSIFCRVRSGAFFAVGHGGFHKIHKYWIGR